MATLAEKSGGKRFDFLGGNTLVGKCPSCGKNQEGSSLFSNISNGAVLDFVQYALLSFWVSKSSGKRV